MASLSGWQGRRLLQTKFEQRLAGHLDGLALLRDGSHRTDARANGRALPGIAADGSECRAQSSASQNTFGSSLTAAAAFHFVITRKQADRTCRRQRC